MTKFVIAVIMIIALFGCGTQPPLVLCGEQNVVTIQCQPPFGDLYNGSYPDAQLTTSGSSLIISFQYLDQTEIILPSSSCIAYQQMMQQCYDQQFQN